MNLKIKMRSVTLLRQFSGLALQKMDLFAESCQSVDVVCMRGWGWISLVVAIMMISVEIFGGPSKPHQSWLMEISPYIESVEIVRGKHGIEVYLEGYTDWECYENQEIHIVEVPEKEMTKIIPRFQKSLIERLCSGKLSHFRIKAADLDSQNPNSYNLQILGQRGWLKHRVQAAPELGPRPVEEPITQ